MTHNTNDPPEHLTTEERTRLRKSASTGTPGGFTDDIVLRLLDEIERRPPPLVWRKEPPDQPGWWWYRKYPSWEAAVVLVIQDENRTLRMDGWAMKRYRGGEWCPIPQPIEARE